MDLKIAIFFILTCANLLAFGEDKTFHNKGVYVKVMGTAGTIVASRSFNIDADDKKVTVTFVELSEVNTTNNAPLPNKTIALSEKTYTLMGPVDESVGSLKADVVTATVTGNPAIEIKTYIFKDAGEIDFSGEKTQIAVGDVKFSIKISSYVFSTDPATTELQLKVKVKGTSATPTNMTSNPGTDGIAFNLGDGSSIKLSKKVKKDSTFEAMRETFPTLDEDTFIFRLPKFTTDVAYDPVITINPNIIRMIKAEGVEVTVKAMTGTIIASRSGNKVTMTFGEVLEMNEETVVNKSNFTDVIFIVDDVKDVNISSTSIMASMVTATGTVMGGTLEAKIFLVKGEGELTVGTGDSAEKTTVMKGDVKVELQLSGYNLTENNGVDVTMEIKGQDATPKVLSGNNTAFDLGNKSTLFLSKMITLDTTAQNMTASYPKVKNGAVFQYRFPNFNGKTLTYDPIIRLGNMTETPGGGGGGTGSGSIPIFSSVLIVLAVPLSQFFK
ncbi:uncharacterized protein LOC121383016 isoform X2 [Gigantopelta aegis]|nr:uncharacterized protein LOC121383016 isoform X2 [Gigantopelta aegis]XP_041368706.1 uncharacterized protein LOC121383016 isoform X2 [Gigantopelta aegis]